MSVCLTIGRRHRSEHDSIESAQQRYCALRDESGEGASTWPNGTITMPGSGKTLRISYNGRVWDGATVVSP